MRYNMKTRFVCGCILCLGIASVLTACAGIPGRMEAYSGSFFAMDTYMTFTVYDDSARDAQTALEQAEERIHELEGMWSVTDESSDIYAVNHGGGQPVKVQKDTEGLLSFALEMAEETGGALEPTLYPVLTAWGFTTGENQIPPAERIESLRQSVGYDRVVLTGDTVTLEEDMMLDPGAIGKGYAGDEAGQLLRQSGIISALLDIGGNIQAIGSKPDGSDWRLGIRSPFGEENEVLGVLRISDCAVVTSGNYERYFIGDDGVRYGHIIDPETGYPVDNGLASVTVIAKEGKLCDALSTALFVMGVERAVSYWESRQDFDMLLVTEDGEIYMTEEIKRKFDLRDKYKNMAIQEIF